MARQLLNAILICIFASACQNQKAFPRPQHTNVPASAPMVRAVKPNWNARLLQAAKIGDYEAVADALRHGASPNTRGFYDMSALLEAVSRHDTAIATLLLDHGADPNQPKKDGVTPIFLATVFPPTDARDLSLAALLVERGADVTRPGADGQTPLLWVAFYGHVPIADFLVQHGADVNAVDRFGQTPLFMAERQHHEDMISFLTTHGATRR
jgi:ankyrin repeat protein